MSSFLDRLNRIGFVSWAFVIVWAIVFIVALNPGAPLWEWFLIGFQWILAGFMTATAVHTYRKMKKRSFDDY